MIDTATEFGARATRRLDSELIGWLTTVTPKGVPVPIPVWFWWDGDALWLYSQPNTPKLRNIAANPSVSLHLDGDGRGGAVVVVTDTAAVAGSPPADAVPAYIAKYTELIAGYGWTPASFAADYSVAVQITPTRLRGH